MKTARIVTAAGLGALAAAIGTSPASAAEPIKVVASFSILGDLVHEVAGDRAEIVTLVGPNGDAHVYEPSPNDARETAAADLVVVNGLGFEGWIDRLIEASGYSGAVAVASTGIEPIAMTMEEEDDHGADDAHEHQEEHEDGHGHHHGDRDPHAWQSVPNAVVYVRNVADALCGADPQDCDAFRDNAAAYTAELEALDGRIRASFANVPEDKRKVITSHDAFGYFGATYGVEFLAPQGVSTESEASAADVAGLIEQIRAEGARALFVENISDPRLLEQIATETDARIGGELYSDALSDAEGPASTYIDMMEHNAGAIAGALKQS